MLYSRSYLSALLSWSVADDGGSGAVARSDRTLLRLMFLRSSMQPWRKCGCRNSHVWFSFFRFECIMSLTLLKPYTKIHKHPLEFSLLSLQQILLLHFAPFVHLSFSPSPSFSFMFAAHSQSRIQSQQSKVISSHRTYYWVDVQSSANCYAWNTVGEHFWKMWWDCRLGITRHCLTRK